MLHRNNQYPELKPGYMISMGNQTDLALGTLVQYFKTADQVDVIAVYAEGLNDLDGLEFCKALQEAVLANKEVIFYNAGRILKGADSIQSDDFHMTLTWFKERTRQNIATLLAEKNWPWMPSGAPMGFMVKKSLTNRNKV